MYELKNTYITIITWNWEQRRQKLNRQRNKRENTVNAQIEIWKNGNATTLEHHENISVHALY